MKLLVDVGNSRIKWAFGVAGQFVAEGVSSVGSDEAFATLAESGHVPEEIRIANVAGSEAGARIATKLHDFFRLAPVFARSAAIGAGIRNGYSDPEQLGIDRWLAMCAAFARYQAPVCVVDAGTATTFDLVTAHGEHLGGLISPGIELMQSALLHGTGNLARLSVRPNPGIVDGSTGDALASGAAASRIVLGRDTDAAILYGAVQATACLARECIEMLCVGALAGTGSGVLVVTGGAAPALETALLRLGAMQGAGAAHPFRLERPHQLVLEGLALEPPCFAVGS